MKSLSPEDFAAIVFMMPLLLLFPLYTEAIHIRNITFRRAWEWVQRFWATKQAEPCPLRPKYTTAHSFAHPQGACILKPLRGALSLWRSRHPLKSHLLHLPLSDTDSCPCPHFHPSFSIKPGPGELGSMSNCVGAREGCSPLGLWKMG